jgi:hypothetical protein
VDAIFDFAHDPLTRGIMSTKARPVRTGSGLLRRLTAGGLKIKRLSCCTHRQTPTLQAN